MGKVLADFVLKVANVAALPDDNTPEKEGRLAYTEAEKGLHRDNGTSWDLVATQNAVISNAGDVPFTPATPEHWVLYAPENAGEGLAAMVAALANAFSEIDVGVESVTGSDGVTVDNTDPKNPITKLTGAIVEPGSYTNANITVDQFGRVTAAEDGESAGAIAVTDGTTIVDPASLLTFDPDYFETTDLDDGNAVVTFKGGIGSLPDFGAATAVVISSGMLDISSVSSRNIIVQAESGSADTVTQIVGLGDGKAAIFQADTGDTITFEHGSDIILYGADDLDITGTDLLMLIGRGSDIVTQPMDEKGAGDGGSATRSVTFCFEGELETGERPARIYNNFGVTLTVIGVYLAVGTAPTGDDIIVDIHKNGTTIFTTQANRPEIAASANTGSSTSIDVTSWASGDYLTFDIDQLGSSVKGSDLTVQILVQE